MEKQKKVRSPLGRFFGGLALAVIALGVFLFLASHSLNFFQFTFSADQQVYSYLGILLTSGGAVGWLMVFMWNAETVIQRGTALIMMIVALLAELVTAVYDMQYAAVYSKIELMPEELKTMTTIVGVFGLVTGVALVAYTAGDRIKFAFKDTDGDGIIDLLDPEPNTPRQRPQERPQQPQSRRNEFAPVHSETKAETLADEDFPQGQGKS